VNLNNPGRGSLLGNFRKKKRPFQKKEEKLPTEESAPKRSSGKEGWGKRIRPLGKDSTWGKN